MITRIRDIRGENIDWTALGQRFKKFREARHMSCIEAAQEINLTEAVIINFESGFYAERKSTNILWSISLTWDLSLNWLLNGVGKAHDPDPLSLMPETLYVHKGAGIRRNYDRLEAEEGSYTDCILEFVMAIDKFKSRNQVLFPTLTQIYEIVKALGYRKSVPARIAPLGYIVEHQQWAEKLKLINEKIEASLDDEEDRRREIYKDRREMCKNKPLRERVSLLRATVKRAKKVLPSKVRYNIKKRKQRAATIANNTTISEAEKQRRLKIGKNIRTKGKKYFFFDSENRQHLVDNLPKFCRDNQLMPAHMYSVASGQRKQHKGWRAEAISLVKPVKPVKQTTEQNNVEISDNHVLERIRLGLKSE